MLTKSAFRRLCSARDLLRETHDQVLSIREIAREADMSPFHFIRQFDAVFGATPHQFRIQARLDRAKHLLALSDYSVTDVCMEVGFTSLWKLQRPVRASRGRVSVRLPSTGPFDRARAGRVASSPDTRVPHVDGRGVRNFREAPR